MGEKVFWIIFVVACICIVTWYGFLAVVGIKLVNVVGTDGLKTVIERIWEGKK